MHFSRVAPAAFVAAFPFLAAALPQDKDTLRDAAQYLRSNPENEVRRGVELALSQDGAEAADLLLEVLRGQQPHKRDIVWEGIPLLRTEEAREQVVTALKKAKRDPRVRQWCVQALGLYGDEQYAKPVLGALGDKEPYVRSTAAWALGVLGVDGGKKLDKLAKDKDPYARGESWIARGRLRGEAEWPAYSAALADPDGGVRCALLGAVPELFPDHVLDTAVAGLADEDWRVRMQAGENLLVVGGREALEAQIGAMDDVRPPLRDAALHALQVWTGQKWTKSKQWRLWLEQQGADYEPPPVPKDIRERENEAGADESVAEVIFDGVRVRTDDVVFLIDKSRSMGEWLVATDSTKEEAARAALEAALLPRLDGLEFNVVTYNSELAHLDKAPLPLTQKTLTKALKFTDDQNLVGNKDIWAALTAVVGDGRYDTVFLLSSGEPEIGLYVHHNRVAAHLADLNRYHKVVVHTVAYSDSEWYRSQLEKISEVTGGEFRWYE